MKHKRKKKNKMILREDQMNQMAAEWHDVFKR